MTWIGSLIESVANTGLKAAGNIGRTAYSGGLIGRTVLGAGIGSAAGFFTSDSDTGWGKLDDMGRGAFLGALGGAAAHGVIKSTPAILKNIRQMSFKGRLKQVANLGINTASRGIGMSAWAIAHPVATAGIVGTGVLAYHVAKTGGGMSSPTLAGASVSSNYNQQSIASEQMSSGMAPMGEIGTAPQMLNPSVQRFQGSTSGLVQGLHSRRH